MKNDSGMYPIETPMDSWFDSNNDGELSGLETMQRDAMLYESYKQTSDESEDFDSCSPAKFNSYKYEEEKSAETNNTSPANTGWVEVLAPIFAILIIIGSLVLAVKAEAAILFFIGAALGAFVLWATGLLSFK